MSDCTVVVATRDRPALLAEAVESALAQTLARTPVLVVDDGSDPPASLPRDPRLTIVRHVRPRGVSAARNLGLSLATTPYVAFLDDDDRLRPHMVEHSLATLAAAVAPPPVAALSGLAVVDPDGSVVQVRLPPALRARGGRFSLEPVEDGRSYFSKQTLVAPRAVLLEVGGFDERLRARVTTELFWRLNPACSLVGSDEITYELRNHPGPRLSSDRRLRQRAFWQLVRRNHELLRAHPDGYAELLVQHAFRSLAEGQRTAALAATLWRARIAPRQTVADVVHRLAG